MKVRLESKRQADEYFELLLKEIRGIKIKGIHAHYSFCNQDRSFATEDSVYVILENNKAIIITFSTYSRAYVDYRELKENEMSMLYSSEDLFNKVYKTYDYYTQLQSLTEIFSTEYSDISNIQVVGFNEEHEVWINSKEITMPQGGDYYNEINIIFSNGNVLHIYPDEEPDSDTYIRIEKLNVESEECINNDYLERIKKLTKLCEQDVLDEKNIDELLKKLDVNQYVGRDKEPLLYLCMEHQTVDNAIKIFDLFEKNGYLFDICIEYTLRNICITIVDNNIFKLVEHILSTVKKRNSIDFNMLINTWNEEISGNLAAGINVTQEYIEEMKKCIELFKEKI